MNTHEETLSQTITQTESKSQRIILKATKPQALRSARPMKSMVKIRSLKPKRIDVGTTLRRKPIKA